MVRQLTDVRAKADRCLSEWATLTDDHARPFPTESLRTLAEQREDLQRGLAEAEREIAELEAAVMSPLDIQAVLDNVMQVYECLMPHERKKLARLLLHRVEVSERRITLEIRGGGCSPEGESASRSERPSWLPDEDSNLEPSG